MIHNSLASTIQFGNNMKKLIFLIISGFLVVGTFGCQDSPSANNGTTQAPVKSASQTTGKTTKSPEKLTPTSTVDKKTKSQVDLKTAVSQKLQVGLPGNKLEVENKQDEIILKGIATSQEELEKAEKLVKQVKGVKTVKVEAKVTPANKL